MLHWNRTIIQFLVVIILMHVYLEDLIQGCLQYQKLPCTYKVVKLIKIYVWNIIHDFTYWLLCDQEYDVMNFNMVKMREQTWQEWTPCFETIALFYEFIIVIVIVLRILLGVTVLSPQKIVDVFFTSTITWLVSLFELGVKMHWY